MRSAVSANGTRQQRLTALAAVLLILAVLCSAARASERYRYIEITGNSTTRFDWEISDGNPVTITSTEADKVFRNTCLPDGSQLKWEVSGKTDWIKVARKGDSLHFNAFINGKQIQKTEALDEAPWFQTLSFSLSRWLPTNRETITFWMVRPDDLDIHKMKAIREGMETVEVNGDRIRARRVTVKLAGAFSMFWSVSYWFSEKDYQLVRYEGVHGPPGTPKTVITLESLINHSPGRPGVSGDE